MFVRKRKNKTGSISVVVVSKRNGKYIEIKNFGTVKLEVEDLYVKAKQWIDTYEGFFTKTMFLTDRHRSIMPLFDNNLTQN